MNIRPLLQICSIQFKSFYREPAIIFWAVIFPILMAWVLGAAFNKKGESLKKVFIIWDYKHGNSPIRQSLGTPSSIPLEKKFAEDLQSPTIISFQAGNQESSKVALQRGEINLYIEEKENKLIYHFDPHNPEAQTTYLLLERALEGKEKNHREAFISPITDLGNRYIDFLIPGLIAMGIMNSCIWGISYNLIEFRMKKLLRRMVATPMKKSDFLLAQMLTRIIITLIEAVLLFAFAYFYFGVSITGSWLALLLTFLAGISAFCGIAILISSRAQNSQVGNGIINAIILPMTILSGVFFSYHNFPNWAVSIIKVLPLTMLADTMRSIFIEGFGMEQALTPILILTIEGMILFFAGLKLYKWH